MSWASQNFSFTGGNLLVSLCLLFFKHYSKTPESASISGAFFLAGLAFNFFSIFWSVKFKGGGKVKCKKCERHVEIKLDDSLGLDLLHGSYNFGLFIFAYGLLYLALALMTFFSRHSEKFATVLHTDIAVTVVLGILHFFVGIREKNKKVYCPYCNEELNLKFSGRKWINK